MLDPITELILIKEKKNQRYLNEDMGLLSWLAAAGLTAYVAPKVVTFIKHHVKLKKECGKLIDQQKEDCLDSIKAGFNRNALYILRQAKMQCPKTTDPQRCDREIDDRIRMFTY